MVFLWKSWNVSEIARPFDYPIFPNLESFVNIVTHTKRLQYSEIKSGNSQNTSRSRYAYVLDVVFNL